LLEISNSLTKKYKIDPNYQYQDKSGGKCINLSFPVINKKLDYHCCPTKNALKVLESLPGQGGKRRMIHSPPAKRTVELRTVDSEG